MTGGGVGGAVNTSCITELRLEGERGVNEDS